MTQLSKSLVPSLSILFITIFCSDSFAAAKCDAMKGCDKKACYVEEKISIAQQVGNTRQEYELTLALENIKNYCTVDGLKADLVAGIDKSRKKIGEYELDLLAAQKKDKPDKVLKYEKKIQSEKENITQLEAELLELSEI